MMMFLKMTLLLGLGWSNITLAENLGLTQEVSTRYLKYSFQPKDRQVVKTLGHREKFLEQNTEFLRGRVTPMLERFEQIYHYSLKNGLPLTHYNPTYKVESVSKETLVNLKKFTYPINIKWMSRKSTPKGNEFLELTLTKVPSLEAFINMMISYENILNLNLPRKPLDTSNLKKRILTKQEQEMLEPIKWKEMTFHKYYQYYGVYYKFSGLVHGEYFADLKEHLKSEFADIQQNFKHEFSRSSDVNMAINSKILANLAVQIENSDFKNLVKPFTIAENQLPKSYLRIYKNSPAGEITFLFARKEKSDSILSPLKKIIDKL